ncbi:Hypothetical predicted protein [Cloeon dipterum]|uniref:Uncharacterized protein n=1 Tax=Cloeon dipterum TaxID=197152 RepID=A0A8S1CQT2_9INSE|nr:Hypothetical predicted protein [Cloeon dipterum]
MLCIVDVNWQEGNHWFQGSWKEMNEIGVRGGHLLSQNAFCRCCLREEEKPKREGKLCRGAARECVRKSQIDLLTPHLYLL